MFVEYYQGTNIMLEDFLSYIVEELSINKADKLLLAVSGGVDSMVMVDLLIKSGYDCEVAHVNHSTRNGQSNMDAEFVLNECLRLDIPCHIKVLDYDILSKGNFQANARDARYSFFESIITDNHIGYLATAHHMDDRWETFVMNLDRKSGISGLTSLKPKTGHVIRPLMRFTKSEIASYSLENKISFVEDASNNTDDYTRNKVRHHLTKAVNKIFPNFIKNVNQSINNLERTNNLIDNLILSGRFIEHSIDHKIIDLIKINNNNSAIELLYHIISGDGFTHSDTQDIILSKTTGSMYYSSTHEGLYDRGRLIIRIKKEKIDNHISLIKNGEFILQDGRIGHFNNSLESDKKDSLDFSYPSKKEDSVILRSIKPGDKYKPSHMKGKTKTLKKLLNDLKVNRFTKEELLVLEINGEIKKIIGLK